MDIWLQGNMEAHSFIDEEYWKKNFDSVKSVLPNVEVSVYEEGEKVWDASEWMRNISLGFL